MNIIVEKYIRECNKNITETTIKSYIVNLKKIIELLKITDINIFYKDYQKIINFIKTEYSSSDNSQRNKLTSCNAIIKCLINDNNKKDIEKALEEYIKEINILREKIDKQLDTHIKSDKEKEGWLSKKEIKLISEKLLKKIPEEIDDLRKEIIHQANNLKPRKMKMKFYKNYPVEHQEGNTECGMYSLFFIITMLTAKVDGMPKLSLAKKIKMFKGGKIPDSYVEKYRFVYFNFE